MPFRQASGASALANSLYQVLGAIFLRQLKLRSELQGIHGSRIEMSDDLATRFQNDLFWEELLDLDVVNVESVVSVETWKHYERLADDALLDVFDFSVILDSHLRISS